jgi:predicted DNA-binding ribbon-helix-helix protein
MIKKASAWQSPSSQADASALTLGTHIQTLVLSYGKDQGRRYHTVENAGQFGALLPSALQKLNALGHNANMGHGARRSSVIKKRSISIASHKTSITLEDEFWASLKAIAQDRNQTIAQLIASIDSNRELANLSSALRMFVLRYYRNQLHQ